MKTKYNILLLVAVVIFQFIFWYSPQLFNNTRVFVDNKPTFYIILSISVIASFLILILNIRRANKNLVWSVIGLLLTVFSVGSLMLVQSFSNFGF